MTLISHASRYRYDANGNTLSDRSGKSYTWDFDNRVASTFVPGAGTVTLKYDPFGRRIQKSSALGTTNYLYDVAENGPNLIEEIDSSGSVLARYTQSTGIDQSLAELRVGMASFYEQDGLGSVTSLSNPAGVLVGTYVYDSFGKLATSTGTLASPFQFTAREFDPETGIYEYRARYYDQDDGRFISEDPIRVKGGINFYGGWPTSAVYRCTSSLPRPKSPGGCPTSRAFRDVGVPKVASITTDERAGTHGSHFSNPARSAAPPIGIGFEVVTAKTRCTRTRCSPPAHYQRYLPPR